LKDVLIAAESGLFTWGVLVAGERNLTAMAVENQLKIVLVLIKL
jgi:hypothetical protein